MIILSGLCLPPETQAIQVTTSLFGAEAVAVVGEVRITWEMETDVVGGGMGLDRVCQQDACVPFERNEDGRPAPGVFRMRVDGVRNLIVVAPDSAKLKAALEKTKFLAEGPKGTVAIPLTAFASEARDTRRR